MVFNNRFSHYLPYERYGGLGSLIRDHKFLQVLFLEPTEEEKAFKELFLCYALQGKNLNALIKERENVYEVVTRAHMLLRFNRLGLVDGGLIAATNFLAHPGKFKLETGKGQPLISLSPKLGDDWSLLPFSKSSTEPFLNCGGSERFAHPLFRSQWMMEQFFRPTDKQIKENAKQWAEQLSRLLHPTFEDLKKNVDEVMKELQIALSRYLRGAEEEKASADPPRDMEASATSHLKASVTIKPKLDYWEAITSSPLFDDGCI